MDPLNRQKISDAVAILLEVLESPEAKQRPVDPLLSPQPKRRFIAWGKTKSEEFCRGVLWIEEQLGVNASFLMACMKFESNLNPLAQNSQSSATGLIQFMDATVAVMRKQYPELQNLFPTVRRARDLLALTDLKQLSWVYYYFKAFKNQSSWTLEDTYMAILLPNMIGKPLDARMNWNENAYRVNAGLDLNRDKVITKAEAAARVVSLWKQGLQVGNAG